MLNPRLRGRFILRLIKIRAKKRCVHARKYIGDGWQKAAIQDSRRPAGDASHRGRRFPKKGARWPCAHGQRRNPTSSRIHRWTPPSSEQKTFRTQPKPSFCPFRSGCCKSLAQYSITLLTSHSHNALNYLSTHESFLKDLIRPVVES